MREEEEAGEGGRNSKKMDGKIDDKRKKRKPEREGMKELKGRNVTGESESGKARKMQQ